MDTSKLSKNVTYKPKDALRAIGENIPENQRGRMSRERVEMVKALVSQGYSIVGYGEVTPSTADAAPVIEKVTTDPNVIVDLYYRYSETDYKAVSKSTGEVFGMREACQTKGCGYSLVGHLCDEPTVLGHAVEIVRK